MKRLTALLGIILVSVAATAVYAQQPTAPSDPHHEQVPATPPSGATSGPRPGGPAGGMMPMEMCSQMMMGGMMGGMMPMGAGSRSMDPKMMAQMMEMRGEMMKAMGDIMMKHAKKMQTMPR
jgi:hypothetical protein